MRCVGALAPWFAQGAGQLRRQGGSTCHPPRPVIAASAVVLTRPPVPTPTPETTALAARGSPLLPLSPPSPPLAFFLCRRRSSPLPLPPWSLLPVFSLCRRHLPCQPPPARLPPLSPPPACCRHCRRPAAPALGPPAVPPVGPWMAAPPSVRTATCGSILRFYLPPSPHPALHSRLSVAPGACTASPGRGTCVGGRRGGGQSAGEEEVAKITIRKRGEETTTTKGEQTTNGGGKGGRGQGTPRRCRSLCCCCWERDDDASPADSPRRCRSLCCCWKRDDDTSPADSPRCRLSCCCCCCWKRDGDTHPANSPRRCAACSAAAGRGTTTPRPGGRFCMAKYAAISPVFAGTAKSDAARQAARVGDAHPSTHRPVRLFPPSRRGCAS